MTKRTTSIQSVRTGPNDTVGSYTGAFHAEPLLDYLGATLYASCGEWALTRLFVASLEDCLAYEKRTRSDAFIALMESLFSAECQPSPMGLPKTRILRDAIGHLESAFPLQWFLWEHYKRVCRTALYQPGSPLWPLGQLAGELDRLLQAGCPDASIWHRSWPTPDETADEGQLSGGVLGSQYRFFNKRPLDGVIAKLDTLREDFVHSDEVGFNTSVYSLEVIHGADWVRFRFCSRQLRVNKKWTFWPIKRTWLELHANTLGIAVQIARKANTVSRLMPLHPGNFAKLTFGNPIVNSLCQSSPFLKPILEGVFVAFYNSQLPVSLDFLRREDRNEHLSRIPLKVSFQNLTGYTNRRTLFSAVGSVPLSKQEGALGSLSIYVLQRMKPLLCQAQYVRLLHTLRTEGIDWLVPYLEAYDRKGKEPVWVAQVLKGWFRHLHKTLNLSVDDLHVLDDIVLMIGQTNRLEWLLPWEVNELGPLHDRLQIEQRARTQLRGSLGTSGMLVLPLPAPYQLIDTHDTLSREGFVMNHCVYSRYGQIGQGTCAIYHYEDGVHAYTLELGQDSHAVYYWREIRGVNNTLPDEEIRHRFDADLQTTVNQLLPW